MTRSTIATALVVTFIAILGGQAVSETDSQTGVSTVQQSGKKKGSHDGE